MPDKPTSGRIAFRVSAGTYLGMGHLVRCVHLARAMRACDFRVVFLVDQNHDALAPWLQGFEMQSLYTQGQFTSEIDDAQKCVQHISEGDWLVVDDYRLGEQWETALKRKAERVIVIDDLANRKHDCDFLIDYRWCEQNHHQMRYQGLVPANCQQLLGPDYCLLAPQYAEKNAEEGAEEGAEKCAQRTAEPFVVLLSLGGGGDISLLANLLRELVNETKDQNIEFWPVVGALGKQSSALDKLADEYRNIKPLRGVTNLAAYYAKASLFMGAAGTSIYEVNAMGLPAITFSLADNQNNARADLDALGLYFHLSQQEFFSAKAMAPLLIAFKNNYQRVQELVDRRQIRIDGKGVARVVSHLVDGASIGGHVQDSERPEQHNSSGYVEELKPDIYVQAIEDSEINRYLDARNLGANRERMSVSEVIPRSEHYRWWFTHSRQIFVLRRANQKLLYIWHQSRSFQGGEYLIGGWMVAGEDCGFDITALALKWQLDFCKQQHPQATWVAIINKENRFVNLLNSLHGFAEVSVDSIEAQAIEHFFPGANKQNFNYVACKPVARTQEVVYS